MVEMDRECFCVDIVPVQPLDGTSLPTLTPPAFTAFITPLSLITDRQIRYPMDSQEKSTTPSRVLGAFFRLQTEITAWDLFHIDPREVE